MCRTFPEHFACSFSVHFPASLGNNNKNFQGGGGGAGTRTRLHLDQAYAFMVKPTHPHLPLLVFI